MKKLILSFCLMMMAASGFAQAPNWIWGRRAGGLNTDTGRGIFADANGNSYTTGNFGSTTISFDTITLTNSTNGTGSDLFVVKHNASGDVMWAKNAAGTATQWGYSVCADAIGNVYLAGSYYDGTIVFGSDSLTNSGITDAFVVKYDASGNVLWAKKAGGTENDDGYGITVDAKGNVYVTGTFKSPTIVFDGITLTNAGTYDNFLVKYNSAGNVQWARKTGGTLWDQSYSTDVDSNGNVFITGTFASSTITFDGTTLTNAGGYDIFIAKYDSLGTVIWAKKAGGSNDEFGTSISVDAGGNSHITGRFYSPTITFGSFTLTNIGGCDIFIVKYDSNGSVVWANSAGSAFSDGISVDINSNVYVAGHFNGSSMNFGSITLMAPGATNIFVAKYDNSGNVLWAKSANGAYSDQCYAICVDANGNTYITGDFWSTSLPFGPDTLINANTSNITTDIYIAKLDNVVGINENSATSDAINIFPNPATNQLTIETTEKAGIEILNMQGQVVKCIASDGKASVDVASLARGMYFVKAKTDEGIMVRKFIKQ